MENQAPKVTNTLQRKVDAVSHQNFKSGMQIPVVTQQITRLQEPTSSPPAESPQVPS